MNPEMDIEPCTGGRICWRVQLQRNVCFTYNRITKRVCIWSYKRCNNVPGIIGKIKHFIAKAMFVLYWLASCNAVNFIF